MNERELKFWNYFYMFSVLGVRDKDMRVMLLRFNHGMTIRKIARLEEVSYQAIDQRVKRSMKRVEMSGVLKKFV